MKISFVIPSYDSVTWLPHAVTSCLQQTHPDVEVVIVDDGSRDRTPEYLRFIEKDERVRIVRNAENRGRSYSRNAGNEAATGEVICVLDADDLATPNRAEIVAKKFRATDVDYFYGPATVIDVLGRPLYVLGADTVDREKCFSEEKNPRLQNRIVHSTVAYSKEFSRRFKYLEGDVARLGIDDWAMQVEAMTQGAKFDFPVQRLACYRQLAAQVTSTRNEDEVLAAKRAVLSALRVTA